MKRWHSLFLCMLTLVLALSAVQPVRAAPLADTTYIVQAGDSLTRIAARYGLSVSQLAAANGLGSNSWVYAGQRLTIPTGTPVNPPAVPSGSTYVVQRGDTLTRIAVLHGVRVGDLASLNGLRWNSWVYVGQRLAIPGAATSPPTQPPAQPAPPPSSSDGWHVVQAGNTLFSIARSYGTTVNAIRAANGLNSDLIYVGQRLRISGGSGDPSPPSAPPAPSPGHGTGGEKWIDINLSQQRITAYEGQTPVYSTLTSTGLPGTPTVVGTFRIYVKYVSTRMRGPGYDLPNVPHTMYFYGGYGIHGAYWHNNFGRPMSHGCVNLSLPDAQWFFNWAPVGTKVVSRY
jgi:LysM repeat protein